ncbi:hypothetical protein DY000_02054632 [Brassica cretica]|uniref:Uncharacterized protein n=1 Tax=Brassica cretica TaxID=69181 RepID=A0ABQ7A5M3_BRACR|nr:hypothetical protein DY000_02054632 [Brassica cretica]
MCFNNDDQVLWDEDPHDVRKGYDMDFVTELVRKLGKDTSPNSYSSSWAYLIDMVKDGALLAVGTRCDKLRQTEPYKSELENMLVQHVFPEFSSPAGHLRAKAAWVAGQYANINFSEQALMYRRELQL